MKRILSLFLAAALLVSFAGAASAKKLIVATDTNFPPFEFKDPASGKHTGFDVELWDAIAKKIGAEYDLQPMDFNGIIPGLQSGQIDVGIAGMTIKPERAKVVDFSDPYYNAGLLILVKSDNKDITDVKSLAGKVVSTKLGTTSEDFVKKEAGAKDVKLFPNNDAMFMELLSGGADAVVFDSPVVSDFMRTAGKGQVKVVGPLYQGQSYGIAFPKGSALKAKADAALKALKDSGAYRTLYMKWFGTEPK
ncbi:MAG TPA: glutamine ABC transporter substrate-binding protein GlnH [Desulfovibrio sp.]|jgi:glutamine transport system substrate-binding protein|uniref:glutamine ABC transporter substrate-binding protein GlnH n=1 Tax=Desulfovibrio TaxID=872 RepID=UPI002A3C5A93|nr:glutamine ABC transporter substrate-binding protein GlnH [Desulfovibrio sp.]MDY0306043.1 glutamine ABC transporter substrate-binding protein GlnH [Desulfovibrionaceae bacterium]HMM39119.1 glutamine ABC transporter substrate-binding protein GlnH [Desulfovibrio sp.]